MTIQRKIADIRNRLFVVTGKEFFVKADIDWLNFQVEVSPLGEGIHISLTFRDEEEFLSLGVEYLVDFALMQLERLKGAQ